MAAVELNSATDNPLVFVGDGSGDIISGGNFHGQPLAMARIKSQLRLRRLRNFRATHRADDQSLDQHASRVLDPGTRNQLRVHDAQVTAAALTSENKALAVPHSVDSISTSGNQEDTFPWA